MINFGSQEEFDEFVAAQQGAGPLPGSEPSVPAPTQAEVPDEVPSPVLSRPGRASIEEIRTEAR